MDGYYDLTTAPAAYLSIRWLPNTITALYGTLWTYTYFAIIYLSSRDGTYGMPILPLLMNFTWELTYSFVLPAPGVVERVVFVTWALVDIVVMWFAVKHVRTEFAHQPFVQRNIRSVLVVGMAVLATGHVAFARLFEPPHVALWSALFCQLVIGPAMLAQLMSRGSSRGTSWSIWATRYVGSSIPPIAVYIRATYWPEAYGWCLCPFFWWGVVVGHVFDLWYAYVLWQIKAEEKVLMMKTK